MLVGFKKRFTPVIKDGSKIHTMRNTPKRMPKIGETMYMYSGLRTSNCCLITKEHTLKYIQKIRVVFHWAKPEKFHYPMIYINNRLLDHIEQNAFYISDGFKDEEDFLSFWNLKKEIEVEFNGYLFHWTNFKY